MRINIRIGGNKNQGFSILFFFILPNNNIGGSVNQSIIKKGLTSIGTSVNNVRFYFACRLYSNFYYWHDKEYKYDPSGFHDY